MIKFLLFIVTLMFIVNASSGCSFIKDRFFKEDTQQIETNQEQAPQEQEQTKPIPVNPSHS